MKTIKLAKDWRHQVNATTVHEYPAGWSGEVSNEAAEHAAAAGVLDAAPAPAKAAPKQSRSSRPAAKKTAAKVETPTPIIDPPPPVEDGTVQTED